MRAPARLGLVLLVTAILAVALASGRRASADGPPPFVVIVSPQNARTSLDRDFVSDAFLKKTTRWSTGEVIQPVDLGPDAPARERFSNDVLRRSVSAVKSYWQQSIFAGRDIPPPELASDDAVVAYVLGHPHAIGYVSGGARLGDTRPVTIH